MKLVKLSEDIVIGLTVFHRRREDIEEEFSTMFLRETFNPDKCARDFIEAIEDEATVAFLEALISQSKKAINRHARWCMDLRDDRPDNEYPDWWTKYQGEGV